MQDLPAHGLVLGRLSVKRDDLTSAAYGGNKVRKLEFLLGRALAEGRRAVLTFGAYGSNHALATAVHARARGIEPHAVLTPQAPTAFARATLLAHAGLGTGLYPSEERELSREAERARASIAERDGIEPMVIPMGGSSALGATGFVDAAFELIEQGSPDTVYVAAGTLGTVVGLAVGFAAAGSRARVVGVRVTPETVANERIASDLIAATVALLRGLDPSFPAITRSECPLELRHDLFGPGYAMADPAVIEAMDAASALGLKLETTYTGKAFAALLADAHAGRLRGKDVLFWDTYSSAPLPAPGPIDALPPLLRDYVLECERGFGSRP